MMEQAPENDTGQGKRSASPPPNSVGSILREARGRLGFSVADVANQIKFAPRQIEALEADDFRQLQGATFLRGFVRSYAKILELDAQPLLAQLPVDKPVPHQLTPDSVEMPFPAVLSMRRQNLIWSGAALLLFVIVVIFGIWHSSTPRTASETAQSQPKAARIETPVTLPPEMKITTELPVVEEHAEPAEPSRPKVKTPSTKVQTSSAEKTASSVHANAESPVPATEKTPVHATAQSSVPANMSPAAQPAIRDQSAKPLSLPETSEADTSQPVYSLRLVFGEESWTEIKDRDGKVISSQINQPGSELRIEGHPPLSMLIGHALSVHLFQDGEEVDLKPYINKYSEVAHITLE